MRFETIQDVLEHGRAMHQQIADFYRQLDDASAQTRVRMLLEYLAEHEQHLAEALHELRSVGDPALMHSFLAHMPDPVQFDAALHVPIRPDMEVDEVLEMALRFDDALIELYQNLAEHTDNEAIRNLLNNLTELENLEKRRVVRNTLMMQDL